jgi:hypothetical protein
MIRQRHYNIGPLALDACSVAFEISLKLALQPESDRAVVGQRHPHVGAENAGFDAALPGASRLHEKIEQLPPLLRRGSGREARPQPLVRVRSQGELRHEQQIALGLRQAQVHFACLVREYAVMQQTIEQPHSGGFAVVRAHAHQDQESGPNGSNALIADIDAGLYNTLQQPNHKNSILFNRL